MFRKHWLYILLGTIALAGTYLVFGTKAFAADPPTRIARTAPNVFDDAPVKPQPWTGIYVSGYYGYGSADAALSIGAFGIDGFALTGQIGGVDIGGDWQVPGSFLVLGARGGYQWGNQEFTVSPALLTVGIDQGWHADARIGAGFGTAMPYVFVGRTVMQTSTSIVGFASPDLKGWRYGAGIEFRLPKIDTGTAFTPTLSLEAIYTDYETLNLGGPVNLNVTDLAAVARLNLKFGR